MRITRIIVLLVFLIVLTGFYSLYSYLDEGLEAQTLQATEEAMVDQVHVLSALIENDLEREEIRFEVIQKAFSKAQSHRFEARIYQKVKQQIGTNFYITDNNGVVLYDSGTPERIGDNMSAYIDVFRTFNGDYGARSTRAVKNDPSTSTMYIAAPIRSEDKIIGVVSLYKPKTDVASFIEGRRRWIIIALCLIGFGIVSFTLAVFFWLFRPLGLLTKYARGIRDGKRPPFPRLGKGKEVNTLGNALKEMRDSLEGRDYLENYVQMLTHELKSPLSAIQGAAELLTEDMPRQHREKFLSNIRHETERSSQIIDGLLQLSKLEKMKQLDIHEHLELPALIHQVLEELKNLLEQKEIRLTLDLSDLHTCHGDPISLCAALSNILQNAIQFTPTKGSIHISTRMDENYAIIKIRDSGPGIPPYATERVFENFYSIARPGTNKKSSGLGLAFVREVAELHQGYAQLENASQGGAIATLALKR